MAQIATIATKTLENLLRAPTGLANGLAAVNIRTGNELAPLRAGQIVAQNIGSDLVEKSTGVHYPTYFVYCEKLNNTLREKFRQFSGTATLAVEVRVTHDRLEHLASSVQHYVDALTETLDANRGDWGDGQFYTGGYQISFGPVKTGGKNYLQVAKATFDLQISK
jgi:hypothetical protein